MALQPHGGIQGGPQAGSTTRSPFGMIRVNVAFEVSAFGIKPPARATASAGVASLPSS